MAVTTANNLFLDHLKDTYSAEKQAIRAYPRLAKAVSSPELKEALQTHLEETKGQVERLDRIFEILEKRSGGKTCEGMKGLIEEAQEHAEEIEDQTVLDSALIAAAQKMEHYEIAAYGTMAAFATAIGEQEIAKLLSETWRKRRLPTRNLPPSQRRSTRQPSPVPKRKKTRTRTKTKRRTSRKLLLQSLQRSRPARRVFTQVTCFHPGGRAMAVGIPSPQLS